MTFRLIKSPGKIYRDCSNSTYDVKLYEFIQSCTNYKSRLIIVAISYLVYYLSYICGLKSYRLLNDLDTGATATDVAFTIWDPDDDRKTGSPPGTWVNSVCA